MCSRKIVVFLSSSELQLKTAATTGMTYSRFHKSSGTQCFWQTRAVEDAAAQTRLSHVCCSCHREPSQALPQEAGHCTSRCCLCDRTKWIQLSPFPLCLLKLCQRLLLGWLMGDILAMCHALILSSLYHTSIADCNATEPRTEEELEFKHTEIKEKEDSSDFLIHWSSAFNVLK